MNLQMAYSDEQCINMIHALCFAGSLYFGDGRYGNPVIHSGVGGSGGGTLHLTGHYIELDGVISSGGETASERLAGREILFRNSDSSQSVTTMYQNHPWEYSWAFHGDDQ